MVSSAVYRYFPSRDDLLTALIIDAYDAVGECAEAADEAARDRGVGALAARLRSRSPWALANAHEYALIYGSPVPGYAAPEATIGPASRVPLVLLRLLVDGVASGEVVAGDTPPMSRVVRSDLAELRRTAAPSVPDAVLSRALGVWAQVLGTINLEMFGHLHNVIHDYDAFFTLQMRRACCAGRCEGRPGRGAVLTRPSRRRDAVLDDQAVTWRLPLPLGGDRETVNRSGVDTILAMAPEPIVEIDGLWKTFGEVSAVEDLSFTVRAGSGLRAPRPERCGQDHDAARAHGARAPDARDDASVRRAGHAR